LRSSIRFYPLSPQGPDHAGDVPAVRRVAEHRLSPHAAQMDNEWGSRSDQERRHAAPRCHPLRSVARRRGRPVGRDPGPCPPRPTGGRPGPRNRPRRRRAPTRASRPPGARRVRRARRAGGRKPPQTSWPGYRPEIPGDRGNHARGQQVLHDGHLRVRGGAVATGLERQWPRPADILQDQCPDDGVLLPAEARCRIVGSVGQPARWSCPVECARRSPRSPLAAGSAPSRPR